VAGETLLPVVQIRFGPEKGLSGSGIVKERSRTVPLQPFITTIPPEHLVEFVHTDKRGADEVNMTFFDPTFGRLEQQIFQTDRERGRMLYRWGYPGQGLEQSPWREVVIRDYMPTLSSSGLRMTLSGLSVGAEFATLCEPRVYKGKISDVVRQIAHELGYRNESKIFIEETDDDSRTATDAIQVAAAGVNTVVKRLALSSAEWATGNKTRIDLINKMLKLAKSKENPNGTYSFRLSSKGSFHFHTEHFKKIKQEVFGSTDPTKETDKRRKYRRFEVLFGNPTNTITFVPRYNSRAMGSYAAASVAGVYDPRLKQFQQRVVDRVHEGMSSNHDPKYARTTAPPLVSPSADRIARRAKADSFTYHPVKQVALGGACSGKQVHQHLGPEMAMNVLTSAWRRMHSHLHGGQLEAVGTPDLVDYSAEEGWTDVLVYLPPDTEYLPGTPSKFLGVNAALHWSSGRYMIVSVQHSITTSYLVSASLRRSTAQEGPAEAKTGPPKKAATPLTGVTK
jgi:hypothetical protein